MTPKKSTTPKADSEAPKKRAARKPKTESADKPAKAPRKTAAHPKTEHIVQAAGAETAAHAAEHKPEHKTEHKTEHKADHKPGKYTYAVGRRKTSVANVRLFSGSEKTTVNHKDILVYFGNQSFVDEAFKPLELTGLTGQMYAYVNISGGGKHSQAQAVAHGVATAIALGNPDFRKVLKKNGLLTRDSRMKERKKPGLKRARRGPQWAKR